MSTLYESAHGQRVHVREEPCKFCGIDHQARRAERLAARIAAIYRRV